VNDIAVISVTDPDQLPPALPLANTNARLGASVFTIGYPRIDVMGKSPKLTKGIISSTNGMRDDPTSYQISVPIQPGNSGGPLLNMHGEVVGLITSMLGTAGAGNNEAVSLPNINYALKIDIIEELLRHLPRQHAVIKELPVGANNLEELANQIHSSVLIVMSE
jgi:S1-C subfamily serine protease